MDLRLEQKTVVITGGASGIGWATAKLFLEEGAHVAIWDRTAPVDSAIAGLEPSAQQLLVCSADVTDGAQLDAALAQTLDAWQRVDHVVHTAAIGSGKFGFPFTNLQPEDWSRVIEVNLLGMVRVAHCVVPKLQQQRSGTLAFVASVAGQIGSQTDPPYSASKAANINFAQCMAKDLASYGIRVNVVNPGMVQTPLNKSVWQAWRETQQGGVEQQSYSQWAEKKIHKLVPLGRWQTAEDVANAIVFLASERAANITGQCINVDGGFVMHS